MLGAAASVGEDSPQPRAAVRDQAASTALPLPVPGMGPPALGRGLVLAGTWCQQLPGLRSSTGDSPAGLYHHHSSHSHRAAKMLGGVLFASRGKDSNYFPLGSAAPVLDLCLPKHANPVSHTHSSPKLPLILSPVVLHPTSTCERGPAATHNLCFVPAVFLCVSES